MDNDKIIEVMGIGGKITEKHVTSKMKIANDGVIINAEFVCSNDEFLNKITDEVKSKLINNSIDYALCINALNLVSNYETLNDTNKQAVYIIEESIKNAIGDYYTKTGLFEVEENNCCCCKCEE